MTPATSSIRTKRNGGIWLSFLALVLAAGLATCDSGPTDLQPNTYTPEPEGLTVSDPVEAGGSPSAGALASSAAQVTYISACPGTFSDRQATITITNLATGETRSVTPIDGGFDPVGLAASADDEIEIVVLHSDGSSTRYLVPVPTKKRPRVVRTLPRRDATDIALSVSLIVIFSEPIDAATLTAETFRLELGDDPVEATRLLSPDGLRAELTPAEALQPNTSYTLVVTEGVLDLGGNPLEEEVQSTFVTAQSPPPPNQPPTVTITSPSDGATIAQGQLIQFSGSATDPEDGVLRGSALLWMSSVDGYIGTDTAFSLLALSTGDHTITLTAADRLSAVGSDTVAISVTPAGPSEYTVTELGMLQGTFTASVAMDLAEPTGGTLLVVGMSKDISGNFGSGPATLWTVTLNGSGGVSGVDIAGLPVPAGFDEGVANAITDAGDIIVGIAGIGMETNIPVMWSGAGWALTELTPLPDQQGGSAYDISNDGTMIAGWSERVPTLWEVSDPTSPIELPSPLGGSSRAYAVNNEGYAVGQSATPNGNYDPWHAILWRPPYTAGRVCDLHSGSGWPWGVGKTQAGGITDVNPADGTVLVTGSGMDDAVIWQVAVADCSIVAITEIGNMVVQTTRVHSVRRVAGGWESAGRHGAFNAFDILPQYTPVLWRLNGGLVEVELPSLTGYRGEAIEVNGAGQIIGWAEVDGTQRAAVWTK
jgi:hypothetical protein